MVPPRWVCACACVCVSRDVFCGIGYHHVSIYLWPEFHLFHPQLSLWQVRKHTTEKRECDLPRIWWPVSESGLDPGDLSWDQLLADSLWMTEWGAFCDIFWKQPLCNDMVDLAEPTLVIEWLSHENIGTCMNESIAAWVVEMFWKHIFLALYFLFIFQIPHWFWFYHQTISLKNFF